VADRLSVLIAARDEEERIAVSVGALRRAFPGADVIVADDGSSDGTAAAAERAGARLLRLPRRGKGQALSVAEREAAAGPLLLVDADVRGALRPLLDEQRDLVVAAFAERRGNGFGIGKGVARALIRLRTGRTLREPLSGQRLLSPAARRAAFPLAPRFGCELRMSIDVLRAGLDLAEVVLPLRHRETGRDAGGFLHRGRQLVDALLAAGPLAQNHRGLRLPIVGWAVAVLAPRAAPVVAIGLADDLWSGDERGLAGHLRAVRTTGVLKLLAIPAAAAVRTRSLSGALLVALTANALNQLDTRPGRAIKAYLAAAIPLRLPILPAVILGPYDLREMGMLGDAGANGLGAVLGFGSVARFTGRSRWLAIGALAGFNVLADRVSLNDVIERSSVLRKLDSLGRADA
jgi:hypothetical protein